MLTIFTTTKPFCNHNAVIQRNAIQSWCRLQPRPEILVFGNGENVAAETERLGVRHIPDVQTNEYGTPLVSDMFAQAERLTDSSILCYVNADIILLSDFCLAVQRIGHYPRFLIVGRRCDLDLREAWDFERPNWEQELRQLAEGAGTLHSAVGIDYFVFPRGFWGILPAFAIGRTAWDNWLIYKARELHAPVVDATGSITAIHQNHDYWHHGEGTVGVWEGPEARRNQELAGGARYSFSIADATHRFTRRGIRPALSFVYLKRRLVTMPVFFPRLDPIVTPLIEFIRSLRKPTTRTTIL